MSAILEEASSRAAWTSSTRGVLLTNSRFLPQNTVEQRKDDLEEEREMHRGGKITLLLSECHLH